MTKSKPDQKKPETRFWIDITKDPHRHRHVALVHDDGGEPHGHYLCRPEQLPAVAEAIREKLNPWRKLEWDALPCGRPVLARGGDKFRIISIRNGGQIADVGNFHAGRAGIWAGMEPVKWLIGDGTEWRELEL